MRSPKPPKAEPVDKAKLEQEKFEEIQLARKVADQQMLEQRRNMLQFTTKGLRI